MENSHTQQLSNSSACNSTIAKRLSKCRIRPCTYYAYVEAGSGAFAHLQVVKTNDALRGKYKYPAMTDYEAEFFLHNRILEFDEERMVIRVNKKKRPIKLQDKDFENCVSKSDTLCLIICILIEKGIFGFHEVHTCMETLKVLRHKENEKI